MLQIFVRQSSNIFPFKQIFFPVSPSSLTVADYVPPVLVFLLRVSFQLALAPYPWVYGNELFPLDMRSYLCAFTSSLEPVQVR